MRNSPGYVTGSILGAVCLLSGLGLLIFAPEFSGFFDRGQSGDAIPVWMLLIGFAVLNFVYALVSHFISIRTNNSTAAQPGQKEPPDSGSEA